MIVTFTLKRGDSWTPRPFEWRQGSVSGDPVNLTGCQVRMQIRDRTGALVLDATDYLKVDGPAGAVAVSVPASETAFFPVEKLPFDIELTFPDGTVQSTKTMVLHVIRDETLP